MKYFSVLFLLPLIFFHCKPSGSKMDTSKAANDYMHVPGPIQLRQDRYLLAWSSHPDPKYFKQEYLPAGQVPEHYTEMILVEVALGNYEAHSIALAKAKEINARKTSDPFAQYNVDENKATGEVLLDFIMSQGEGDQTIVEWNIYRYRTKTDETGQAGIALLGWSRRAYGNKAQAFADDLKTNRREYVVPFMQLPFPQVMVPTE